MILVKWQYNKICQFLVVEFYHFQFSLTHPFKKKYWKLRRNWLLSNWSRLVNWKRPGTYPQSSKSLKRFQKNIDLAYIYQLTNFSWWKSCGLKDISNMHPVSFTNTHHDIRDLVNHRMFKNTKTWTSQERNITFLWNKTPPPQMAHFEKLSFCNGGNF